MDGDEHKEILLGNKQLLGIFFVVVVLLGISFSIGYIIGKNTTALHASEPRKTMATEEDPQVRRDPPRQEPPPRSEEPPVDAVPAPAAPAGPAAKAPDPAPATGGIYLQVSALKREDADNMAKVLRNRGYPTVLGESSKEGLFRVLVGPFKSMPDLAESKQRLKASGFESIVVR